MDKRMTLEELCPLVREVGMQRGDAWRQKARRIYDHEFLYCYAGAAHVRIGEESRRMTEGDMAIVPPDTPHTMRLDAADSGDLYWFHCDFARHDDGDLLYRWYNTPETYARCFGAALPQPEHIRAIPVFPGDFRLPTFVRFDVTDDVDMIFRSLYKAYQTGGARFALVSKELFFRLMTRTLTAAGYWDAPGQPQPRVSDTIKRYIQENYARKLSVREMCACTKLNPDYAGKLFKRETGMSLVAYVNAFRVEKAKRLLLSEDRTIADIADRVGFQNENYFCAVSRRVTGMTPAKLRRHMLSLMEPTENEYV